jgi:hypothetical protein
MSNINPQNIDGTYPIAGQDNDSQGFRDNFTNTINNFTFAAAELTDLQTYALLRAPLGSVGQTGTPSNDMNYAFLTAPQVIRVVATTNDVGNVASGGSQTIDWAAGHYQTVGVTEVSSLSFASTWPVNGVWTKLRLRIRSYGSTALTFGSSVTDNIENIKGYTSGRTVFIDDGIHDFEFSSTDNGTTVTIIDLRENYGYKVQRIAPTAVSNIATVATTVNNNVDMLFIVPTANTSVLNASITFPDIRANGTKISIGASTDITELQVNASGISTIKGNTANIVVTAGSSVEYLYLTGDEGWFRIR